IFALIAVAPKGGLFPVLLGVVTSTIVSFVVAMPLVKRNASKMETGEGTEMLEMAKTNVQSMKDLGKTESIYFACDAGMGTSAMGASKLKKMLKEAGITEIKVEHVAVDAIPPTAQLVICQKSLADRAKDTCPTARIFAISNLVNSLEYKEIVDSIAASRK
ncbi:MAG: PTS mannitol transporter subunit IIBC, partial [Treponema sp.]|nr:PTS mannitol transporter subunit IIBC [Treponema sp.]